MGMGDLRRSKRATQACFKMMNMQGLLFSPRILKVHVQRINIKDDR